MKSLSFIALSFLLASIPTAFAEQTAAPSSTTLATSAKTTSVVQATRHETGHMPVASASAGGGGYGDYGSNAVNTDGGASGASSGSFYLSKGALIAIIVVVVTVAVFGIASVVLYILAKRRQWNIRQSIKRASRRLTGRPPPPKSLDEAARRKRSGIVAGSQPATKAAHPPGHKRGLVVEVKDEEKGPLDYGTPPKTEKPQNQWVRKLRGNDWK